MYMHIYVYMYVLPYFFFFQKVLRLPGFGNDLNPICSEHSKKPILIEHLLYAKCLSNQLIFIKSFYSHNAKNSTFIHFADEETNCREQFTPGHTVSD